MASILRSQPQLSKHAKYHMGQIPLHKSHKNQCVRHCAFSIPATSQIAHIFSSLYDVFFRFIPAYCSMLGALSACRQCHAALQKNQLWTCKKSMLRFMMFLETIPDSATKICGIHNWKCLTSIHVKNTLCLICILHVNELFIFYCLFINDLLISVCILKYWLLLSWLDNHIFPFQLACPLEMSVIEWHLGWEC